MSDFLLFDHGPEGAAALFDAPLAVIRAESPEDIAPAFAALEAAQAAGHWLAGFASYELGYCLDEKLRPLLPETRELPLLAFGVFAGPKPAPARQGAARLTRGMPDMDFSAYSKAFARLQDYISAGDCYQVNLTFPIPVASDTAPEALYAALAAHPVPHGVQVSLAGAEILSRSPELFFKVQNGQIETRPMKGTRPRGATPAEDEALCADLLASEKDRAENLMIVDLLRNDISRLCRAGSVRVPELFKVESYRSVHQMVSTITGTLAPEVRLGAILTAMFPCGSVTGAPKIRAMEIIRELEPSPRGIYCGSIGWVAPSGDMAFNVAIRTLMRGAQGWRVNVGGGVVHDSRAEAEYEEALWKARFLNI